MTLRFRPRFRGMRFALALCSMAFVAATCRAQPGKVISVEEHWELKISQPDADRSAPQTTMVMSPRANVDGVHFLVTLNHATVPDYAAGGIQAQLWHGDELVQSTSAHEGTVLDQPEEVITWVQRLALEDGHLTFTLDDGQSTSWGSFGGEEMALGVDANLESLNQYRPGFSIEESQVNYAENRVVSLVLTKLVWTTEDGEVHELSAPIPVDTSLDE
jgi:hypothetical protein